MLRGYVYILATTKILPFVRGEITENQIWQLLSTARRKSSLKAIFTDTSRRKFNFVQNRFLPSRYKSQLSWTLSMWWWIEPKRSEYNILRHLHLFFHSPYLENMQVFFNFCIIDHSDRYGKPVNHSGFNGW